MEVTTNDSVADTTPKVIYRCKKCRRIVASEELVVTHTPGEGQKCFKWKKRGQEESDDSSPECSSIFVEPMKWMESVEEGYMGDKLQCGSCKYRLGNFSWIGIQCNCGTWVRPGFQLHKSRIDECCV